ncbi:MAG TPA: PilT/PilU family type 4a pilus ATPase [Actinomycetota bacterium]|nr:PilT/PilU family type 4a pilus ATPase [Actinomycetota bacterium]
MRDLDSLLRALFDLRGSDLHLKAGAPPLVRVDGLLAPLEGEPVVTAEETEEVLRAIVPAGRWDRFERNHEADFAYQISDLARFRVNAFSQREAVSLVFRLVRVGSPSFEELGLPPVIRQLAVQPRGLVLLTGPTGTGKTTTLAAMIDHINATRRCHILTIEDPIEVIHIDRMASVNQREVGVDTESFVSAMRTAMRQDPDVILIGEMRDMETVQAALAAAETGHLVFSTLHTIDAAETVNRIVDFFPPYQQQQIRVTLSGALRGIVCQRLLPRAGGGRAPAVEVMVNNGRTAECILDPMRTAQINDIVAEGGFYGMQTFDQALLGLVLDGTVTIHDAFDAATNRHDFKLALEQAGVSVPVG